jgi:hypothetical protein
VAMALLRKAVGMGYHRVNAFRADDALEPLRVRTDFQLLMMDLEMPAEPFAGAARQSVNPLRFPQLRRRPVRLGVVGETDPHRSKS